MLLIGDDTIYLLIHAVIQPLVSRREPERYVAVLCFMTTDRWLYLRTNIPDIVLLN